MAGDREVTVLIMLFGYFWELSLLLNRWAWWVDQFLYPASSSSFPWSFFSFTIPLGLSWCFHFPQPDWSLSQTSSSSRSLPRVDQRVPSEQINLALLYYIKELSTFTRAGDMMRAGSGMCPTLTTSWRSGEERALGFTWNCSGMLNHQTENPIPF